MLKKNKNVISLLGAKDKNHLVYLEEFKLHSEKFYLITEIGVKEIKEGLKENILLIVDELGKMELFSPKFRKVILEVLDSKNKILGTIMLKSNPFCDKIKDRPDTKVFYLIRENQKEVKEEILNLLK